MALDADLMVEAIGVGCRFSLSYDRYYTIPGFLLSRWRRLSTGEEKKHDFWALRGVGFGMRRGDILGVVGPNGAGKTTLMRLLGGVFKPDEGRIAVRGKTSVLLSLGTGFNTQLSGRQNIFLNGMFLGRPRRLLEQKFAEIVDFAELWDFIDVPLRYYSNGMMARLSFAIASSIEPDILMVDEVFSVGDEAFQRKSKKRMHELQAHADTQILISHDLNLIRDRCKLVLYLQGGRAVFFGDAREGVERYLGDVDRPAPSKARSPTPSL